MVRRRWSNTAATETATLEPSPLDGLSYGWRAFDFTRFVDDPLDDEIAHVVDDVAAPSLSPVSCSDHAYLLCGWSMRRALISLRQQELAFATAALRGAALATHSLLDFRDFSPDYALLAIRELGGDPIGEARKACSLAEAETGDLLMRRAEESARWRWQDAGATIVRSHYGLGFLTSIGGKTPSDDLAARAIRVADAIDLEGTNEVHSIHTSELSGVWFSARRPPEKVSGCTCVSIGTQIGANGLLGFVVDAGDGRVAESLVQRALASNGDRTVAVSDGGRFMLLVRAVPEGSRARLDCLREMTTAALSNVGS